MGISETDFQNPYLAYREKFDKQDYGGAVKVLDDLLSKDFNDGKALYCLAECYKEIERFGQSFNLYRMASNLLPRSPDPHVGMGLCCTEMWNLDEAERHFRAALKLAPDHAHAMSNLGLVYLYRCRPEESLKWSQRALEAKPDLQGTIQNRAYAKLMLQDWSGWADWQSILGKVKKRTERVYENAKGVIPKWNGETGKTVLVYGEQGIGDEISFASCVPDLIRDSKEVVFDCDKRLQGLFTRSFDCRAHGTRFADPTQWIDQYDIDYRVAVGDLPGFYRTSTEDFPGTPYLNADPERRVGWRALFDSFGKPAIGLAWNGGDISSNGGKRSLPITAFAPIMDAVDATFVSLEYKDRPDCVPTSLKHYPWATQVPDYDNTAALVAELDLVISVTTAVVHLAGALGKEAWVLTPNEPRWLYGLQGTTLPWYSSVKLYRQLGSVWPIEDIARDLKKRYV